MRVSISPAERLAHTLHFLATGNLQELNKNLNMKVLFYSKCYLARKHLRS